MRLGLLCIIAVLAAGCNRTNSQLTLAQKQAIHAELERTLRDAYDLSKPGLPDRMLALYPKSGSIVSAAGGRVQSSRDSLERGIRAFWESTGRNMREPRWVWEKFYVDVLSPTTAVVTATYRIPHRDPRNQPHLIAGAMTAIFEKREGNWVIVQEHLSDLPSAEDSAQTGMPSHDHH